MYYIFYNSERFEIPYKVFVTDLPTIYCLYFINKDSYSINDFNRLKSSQNIKDLVKSM